MGATGKAPGIREAADAPLKARLELPISSLIRQLSANGTAPKRHNKSTTSILMSAMVALLPCLGEKAGAGGQFITGYPTSDP
jgi:hypothetical protein